MSDDVGCKKACQGIHRRKRIALIKELCIEQSENIELMDRLVRETSDVTVMPVSGRGKVTEASLVDFNNVVRKIMRGEELDVNQLRNFSDNDRQALCEFAGRKGNQAVVEQMQEQYIHLRTPEAQLDYALSQGENMTKLDEVLGNITVLDQQKALEKAIEKGNVEACKHLLLKHRSSISFELSSENMHKLLGYIKDVEITQEDRKNRRRYSPEFLHTAVLDDVLWKKHGIHNSTDALCDAVSSGDMQLLQALLQRRTENIQDLGRLLNLVIDKKDTESFKLILQNDYADFRALAQDEALMFKCVEFIDKQPIPKTYEENYYGKLQFLRNVQEKFDVDKFNDVKTFLLLKKVAEGKASQSDNVYVLDILGSPEQIENFFHRFSEERVHELANIAFAKGIGPNVDNFQQSAVGRAIYAVMADAIKDGRYSMDERTLRTYRESKFFSKRGYGTALDWQVVLRGGQFPDGNNELAEVIKYVNDHANTDNSRVELFLEKSGSLVHDPITPEVAKFFIAFELLEKGDMYTLDVAKKIFGVSSRIYERRQGDVNVEEQVNGYIAGMDGVRLGATKSLMEKIAPYIIIAATADPNLDVNKLCDNIRNKAMTLSRVNERTAYLAHIESQGIDQVTRTAGIDKSEGQARGKE